MSEGLLVRSKRLADIEYALMALGLQVDISYDRGFKVGEIVIHHVALPPKGTIVLFRDDKDGSVTIERPMSRHYIGRAGNLVTVGTMISVPVAAVGKVDVLGELFPVERTVDGVLYTSSP